MVCPDQDANDYDASAQGVPCPALGQADPMIKNFIRWHKVEELPTLVIVAEDGTEITNKGVLEMNPPLPEEGQATQTPPQLGTSAVPVSFHNGNFTYISRILQHLSIL